METATLTQVHTAYEWNEILGTRILDYDGFRDGTVTVESKITRSDFELRLVRCTRKHTPMKLTEEQKRVKIAEACGLPVGTPIWQFRFWSADSPSDDIINWSKPYRSKTEAEDAEAKYLAEGYMVSGMVGRKLSLEMIANVFEDLNACHEAEKTLDKAQCDLYYNTLYVRAGILMDDDEDVQYPAQGFVFHFTAAQRAEAFGLTLGLW